MVASAKGIESKKIMRDSGSSSLLNGILIVCEKNKAARAIAEALGPIKVLRKYGVTYYIVPSENAVVIPLRGHILTYENSEKYKKWDITTNRLIITDPGAVKKYPTSYAGPYIKLLKEYAKVCNICINACDADIEGCNIGLIDAYRFIKSANPSIMLKQLWLNTLLPTEIRRAYGNPIPPKWTWAYTGEARAVIDAIIGFSATREVSLTLKPILRSIGVKFVSIGRVQTSLLYLMYLREKEIREFVPETYYSLFLEISPFPHIAMPQYNWDSYKTELPQYKLGVSSPNNKILKKLTPKFYHKSNPFRKKTDVDAVYRKVSKASECEIVSVNSTDNTVNPPTPLNTSKALTLITKVLKIKADTALKVMEDLYLNKIITYPRTDSDIYPPNFDHLPYLDKLARTATYGSYTASLLGAGRLHPVKGKVWAGDHPPITPIIGTDPNSGKFDNDLQRKVYDIIVRSYLASFGPPAVERVLTVKVDINNELFIGRFRFPVVEGFYAIAPFLKPEYTEYARWLDSPGRVVLGQRIKIGKVSRKTRKTSPPARYSDSTLLKLMEKHGLGTKSTRPGHIEKLIERKYIERRRGVFYVTQLGYLLISSLIDIWLPFLEPSFTKHTETLLEEIKVGRKKFMETVDVIRKEFLELFDKFRAEKDRIVKVMERLKSEGNTVFIRKKSGKKSSSRSTALKKSP